MVHAKEKNTDHRKSRGDAVDIPKALKDSAMQQIVDQGLAQLSVRGIVETAGVSKGALFHHFPTKDHLVAEAFGEFLIEFAERLNGLGLALRSGQLSLEQFVEDTFQLTMSNYFVASMEIALGIRANKALQELCVEGIARWRLFFDDFWEDIFVIPEMNAEARKTHWSMAANQLRGYSFKQSFGSDPQERRRMIKGFQNMYLSSAQIRPL